MVDLHGESLAEGWKSCLIYVVSFLQHGKNHLEGRAQLQMGRMTDLCSLQMPPCGLRSLGFSDQGRSWLVLYRFAMASEDLIHWMIDETQPSTPNLSDSLWMLLVAFSIRYRIEIVKEGEWGFRYGENVTWVCVVDVYLHFGSSAAKSSVVCSGLLESGLCGYLLLVLL